MNATTKMLSLLSLVMFVAIGFSGQTSADPADIAAMNTASVVEDANDIEFCQTSDLKSALNTHSQEQFAALSPDYL